MSRMKELILALDTDERSEVLSLVEELHDHVGLFKVGFQLFTRYGPSIVDEIHNRDGRVFLDLKFHDIPRTVAAAARGATELGVAMFNVHASGGSDMLKACVEAASNCAAKQLSEKPILLAVTLLTSISEDVFLHEMRGSGILPEHVGHLALMARDCGMDGVVASAQEVSLIRDVCGAQFKVVTPGIRPLWSLEGDQKRIMTPKEAKEQGVDFIVVGRPILEAEDRLEATLKVKNEWKAASKKGSL